MPQNIELLRVEGESRTPLKEFLSSLEHGIFLTPEVGQWREHDELFHIPRILSLSVDEANFIMDAAQIAGRLLEDGDHYLAGYAAENIDRFLTDFKPQIYNRSQLLQIMREYGGVQSRLF